VARGQVRRESTGESGERRRRKACVALKNVQKDLPGVESKGEKVRGDGSDKMNQGMTQRSKQKGQEERKTLTHGFPT